MVTSLPLFRPACAGPCPAASLDCFLASTSFARRSAALHSLHAAWRPPSSKSGGYTLLAAFLAYAWQPHGQDRKWASRIPLLHRDTAFKIAVQQAAGPNTLACLGEDPMARNWATSMYVNTKYDGHGVYFVH